MTAPADPRVTPSVVEAALRPMEIVGGPHYTPSVTWTEIMGDAITAALAQIDAERPSRTYSDEDVEAATIAYLRAAQPPPDPERDAVLEWAKLYQEATRWSRDDLRLFGRLISLAEHRAPGPSEAVMELLKACEPFARVGGMFDELPYAAQERITAGSLSPDNWRSIATAAQRVRNKG